MYNLGKLCVWKLKPKFRVLYENVCMTLGSLPVTLLLLIASPSSAPHILALVKLNSSSRNKFVFCMFVCHAQGNPLDSKAQRQKKGLGGRQKIFS